MGNSFGESRSYRRGSLKRSATLLSSSCYVYTTAAASTKAREQKLQLERYWIESSMDMPRYNEIMILIQNQNTLHIIIAIVNAQ